MPTVVVAPPPSVTVNVLSPVSAEVRVYVTVGVGLAGLSSPDELPSVQLYGGMPPLAVKVWLEPTPFKVALPGDISMPALMGAMPATP